MKTKTISTFTLKAGLFGMVMALAIGCADTSSQPECEVVEQSGNVYCVIRKDITETGYECPPSFEFQHDVDGFLVCSENAMPPSEWPIEKWSTQNNPTLPIELDNKRADKQMDMLWVIDNSGSMCKSHKVIWEGTKKWVDTIKDNKIDLHVGITTTHAPSSDVPFPLETVAEEAKIQNVPQPVPGSDSFCINAIDSVSNQPIPNNYSPLRQSLEYALECVADPSIKSQFVWTNDQLNCMINQPTTDCAQTLNIPDRNNDASVDIFDAFPMPSEYRTLPKVLKTADYQVDGQLDTESFIRDFRCMSLVGTRGDGFERGLQVAVKAVSKPWTGGAVGEVGADTSAPNHGLIRKDASLSVVFISDENDCSAPDGAIPASNSCAAEQCDFYNSTAMSEAQSPLTPISTLAQDFRTNLAETKGRALGDQGILVSSIVGQSKRLSTPMPSEQMCQSMGWSGRVDATTSCVTALGRAKSGDRYERFMREFKHYYPNAATQNNPQDFSVSEIGWMCIGEFEPALTGISDEIVKVATPAPAFKLPTF